MTATLEDFSFPCWSLAMTSIRFGPSSRVTATVNLPSWPTLNASIISSSTDTLTTAPGIVLPVTLMGLVLTSAPAAGWVITKNKAVGVVVGGSVGVVVAVEVGLGVGVGTGVEVTIGADC